MKAGLLFREKNLREDGTILEVIIWKLPKRTLERPHGLKYRLYYGDSEGNCLVRYDNESGKGDHKHIGDKEFPYRFVDRLTLLNDFYHDVRVCLEKRGGKYG